MTTIDTSGKVAYMYDAGTNKWYAISGAPNTTAAYTWTGTQTFKATVALKDVVLAQAGINNFQTATDRDRIMDKTNILTAPAVGTVAFVRQSPAGNPINDLQYFNGTNWISLRSIVLDLKTSAYTVQIHDANKLIRMNSSTDQSFTIPANSDVAFAVGTRMEFTNLGTGTGYITAASGVSFNSKVSGNPTSISIITRGIAVATKTDTNTWIISGDIGTYSAPPPPPPTFSVAPPPSFVAPPSPPTFVAPVSGIWFSYCDSSNVAQAPQFTSSYTCSQMQASLVAMGEYGKSWQCATGTDVGGAAAVGVTTPTCTPTPPTFTPPSPPTFSVPTIYWTYCDITGTTISSSAAVSSGMYASCTAMHTFLVGNGDIASNWSCSTSPVTAATCTPTPPPTPPSFVAPPTPPSFVAPPPSFVAPPPTFNGGCSGPNPGGCDCINGHWVC